MPKFYLTYPYRDDERRNCYSVIEAESYDEAHAIAIQTLGADFAFLYTEEQFMGTPCKVAKYPSQIEAFNLIEIPL
jgi:hypothetical protein